MVKNNRNIQTDSNLNKLIKANSNGGINILYLLIQYGLFFFISLPVYVLIAYKNMECNHYYKKHK